MDNQGLTENDETAGFRSVSVVVTTRNRADVLEDCLESLVAQDCPTDAYEILIVDDDSTDGTRRVVEEAAARISDPRIRYFHQPQRGPSSGRNLGIRESAGDLIAFVDDDVIAPPSWLPAMLKASRRYPECECFAGRIELRLEGKLPKVCGREPIGESELVLGPHDASVDLDAVAAANMVVRRSAFERVGQMMEDLPVYGEETEWLHRLSAADGQVIYVAEACVWHRRGPRQLQLRNLVRARYHRGRSWPRIAPLIGRHTSVITGIWRIVLALRHALSRTCWVGVFDAAYWCGHTREATAMRLRRAGSPYVTWVPNGIVTRIKDKTLRRRTRGSP